MTLTNIGVAIGGLIVGFLIGKFWYSRKINETVELAKGIVKNPASVQEGAKKIAQIWK